MMKATVLAQMRPQWFAGACDADALRVLAGSNAGICYMQGDYFDNAVSGVGVSRQRFSRVAGMGHHSVADHAQVEVLLEGVPKVVAMVLNNLGCYATSEKSGRYTKMTGSSELECKLYEKWRLLFTDCIAQCYPALDERMRGKLAQENARYMLSVFNDSTVMGYTTSLRQWTYIICWLEYFAAGRNTLFNASALEDKYHFGSKLAGSFSELAKLLREQGLYVEEMESRMPMPFTPYFEGNLVYGTEESPKWDGVQTQVQMLDDIFVARFKTSFVSAAQLQRHRTLHYAFSVEGAESCYVPVMLRGSSLESEWRADMGKLMELGVLPQGAELGIKMWGTIVDFKRMCDERLCGKAQLEVMTKTYEILECMLTANKNMPEEYYWLQDCKDLGRGKWKIPFSKCKAWRCKENCYFIKDGLRNRKV